MPTWPRVAVARRGFGVKGIPKTLMAKKSELDTKLKILKHLGHYRFLFIFCSVKPTGLCLICLF